MSLDEDSEDSLDTNGGECQLCHRRMSVLTRHHLIPQTRHKNRRNKRDFDRVEVKTRIVLLCRPCHSHVHVTLSNKELERDFNTLEALATHPDIAKFAHWISDKPAGLKVAMIKGRSYR